MACEARALSQAKANGAGRNTDAACVVPGSHWQVMENSKYHFIEEVKKMVIDRSEQEIIPLMPTEEMSRLLNISQTKPILEKVSRGYLVDGRVFEYSRNAFNTDDYKFTLIAQRKSSR